MEFLKGVSKENKKEFLSKLQSGLYTLNKLYEPQPPLNFDLQESGLYKCQETGKELTKDEVYKLPGYRGGIQLVSEREQVTGQKPPDNIILMPYMESEYLDSLLIDNPQ